jgi:hypothetical protein
MENNYYTPSIEEFHVGFEFEVNCDNDWIKESLYSNEQVNVLPFMNTNNIRVKYLDKEDIENLGFTCEQKPLGSWDKGEFWVKNKEGVVLMDFDILDKINPEIGFPGISFVIKNKSELKRLLKQLGINGQD